MPELCVTIGTVRGAAARESRQTSSAPERCGTATWFARLDLGGVGQALRKATLVALSQVRHVPICTCSLFCTRP